MTYAGSAYGQAGYAAAPSGETSLVLQSPTGIPATAGMVGGLVDQPRLDATMGVLEGRPVLGFVVSAEPMQATAGAQVGSFAFAVVGSTPLAIPFVLDDEGYGDVEQMLVLHLTEAEILQAPDTVTAVVLDANPAEDAIFTVDGVEVYRYTPDATGDFGPLAIPIPETVLAGQHELVLTSGGQTASALFTVDLDPEPDLIIPEPDAEPVILEPSTSVQRWIFQDRHPLGLGSYILPLNPTSMSPPHYERALEAMPTTAITGRFHVYEGGPAPHEWTFSGYCPDQSMYQMLRAFDGLARRFYVIDHRQRAWLVTFTNVDLRPRRRQQTSSGAFNDWAHDYTVNALIYDREPVAV